MNANLAEMTWPEVAEAVASGYTTVILPLGATEQHGPHLPLSTDTIIAEALARRLAQQVPNALIAPTIPIGCSDEHAGFAGLLSLEAKTLASIIVDCAQRMVDWGVERLIVLSGHGGNGRALQIARQRLQQECPHLAVWLPDDLIGMAQSLVAVAEEEGIVAERVGLHAGDGETSQVLHLRGDLVRQEKATAGYVGNMADVMPTLMQAGLMPVTHNGILGDPTDATAQRGATYLDVQVNALAAAINKRLGPTSDMTRRQRWENALILYEFRNDNQELLASLVAELANYLDLPPSLDLRSNDFSRSGDGRTTEVVTTGVTTGVMRGELYRETWRDGLGGDNDGHNHDDNGNDNHNHNHQRVLGQVLVYEQAQARHAERVLLFGSGIGSLGLLLAQRPAHEKRGRCPELVEGAAGGMDSGVDVTLAEANPHLQAYARWRFAQRDLSATFLDPTSDALPANHFDLIALVDRFESLPDPETSLKQLAPALKLGGLLLIRLPEPGRTSSPAYSTDALLAHIGQSGLWVESMSAQTLFLRRGEAPRYRLNDGLTLREDGMLLSERPLMAIRLNPQAVALFSQLDEAHTAQKAYTAQEMSAALPSLSLPSAISFLEGCVKRHLLLKTPSPDHLTPPISIVVPAHNRPQQTRACIESLLALDYPADKVEILLVDDASEPPLAEVLSDLPIKVLRPPDNIGPSAARNLGIREAKGAWVLFTDNDCVVSSDWVRAMSAYFGDKQTQIVGGRVLSPPPDSYLVAYDAVQSPLDMGQQRGLIGPREPIPYAPSCNLAIRRETALKIGGFSADMWIGEDVDLIWRAIATGGKAEYVPEATIIHHHRDRLKPFLLRRMDYAFSEVDLRHRHPAWERVMMLPVVPIALLLALIALPSWWAASILLLLLVIGRISHQSWRKRQKLEASGVALPLSQIVSAVLRTHQESFHDLGSTITRYYSLPLLLISLIWSPLLLAWLALTLLPAWLDFNRKKPHLPRLAYILIYWLEMGAYQLGLYWGSAHFRTLHTFWPTFKVKW